MTRKGMQNLLAIESREGKKKEEKEEKRIKKKRSQK